MNIILLLFSLVLPVLWYLFGHRWIRVKDSQPKSDCMPFTDKNPSADTSTEFESVVYMLPSDKRSGKPVERVYYSIQGRSFMKYMLNGRIIDN